MDMSLYTRFVTELLMIVPAAALAVIPVYYCRKVNTHYLFGMMSVLLLAAVFGGAAVCTVWGLPSNAVVFTALPVMFFFYNFCFDLTIPKMLFCFANAVLLCGFSTTYTAILTAPLELSNNDNVFTLPSGAICLGVTLVIGGAFIRTLISRFNYLLENETLDTMWKVLDIAPIVTSVAVVWMKPISAENVMTGRLRIICIVVLPSIPIAVFFLYYIFWYIAKKMTDSAELQQSYDLLRMEEKQYQATYRHLINMREMRHDFRQHLLSINEFAQTGQIDKLKEYIAPLIKAVEKKPFQICENQALNAIVSHYDSIAKEQGVRILCGIHLEEALPVNEADVCSVVGNLLENAIHAVSGKSESKRVVDFRIGMIAEKTLAIHISNPFEGLIPLDKEGLPVIKNKNHGTGLRSVQSVAKKYGGEVIILTKHDKFEVDVLMYTDRDETRL